MQITTVDIESVLQDPKNPRRHTRANINLIKRSLESFSQYKPLIIQKSTNIILVGNGTHVAAKELEWNEIDVIIVDVDDEKARALSIVDNRTAEFSNWHNENLLDIIKTVMDEDFIFDSKFDDDFIKSITKVTIDSSDYEEGDKKPKREPPKNGEVSGKTIYVKCPNCGHKYEK